MNRRDLFKAGLGIADGSMLATVAAAKANHPEKFSIGKRKLGPTLEVSAIGLGVQNMSRMYQATII
jgi:hypothetical protein